MDLSTTKKIKRRVLEINPNPNQELTDCNITVANWFQSNNLSNTKFKISSFFMNNTTIPCFIPKYIPSLPSSAVFKDKNPAGVVTLYNDILDQNSLNYWVAVSDPSGNNIHVKYIKMSAPYSEYPSDQPPIHPYSASDQYRHRYYGFYNTSKFCEMVSSQLSSLITTFTILSFKCEIVRQKEGYTLFVESSALALCDIHFSQSLIDLFQFKNVESPQSTQLRTIIFNAQTSTYLGKPCSSVNSNYVGNQWFPYDELIFKSDLPIEPIGFYNNNDYIRQSYQNIILSFRLNNADPDGIYNFLYSEINPESSWVTMINTNSGENATFNILLRLKDTGDLIPYTIKNGEVCKFETITIETY